MCLTTIKKNGTNWALAFADWVTDKSSLRMAEYYCPSLKEKEKEKEKPKKESKKEVNHDMPKVASNLALVEEVYFDQFEKALTSKINADNHLYVVGWCPRINNMALIQALATREGVCIVVLDDPLPHFDEKKNDVKVLQEVAKSWKPFSQKPLYVISVGEKTVFNGNVMIFLNAKKEPVAVWRGSMSWTNEGFFQNKWEEASYSTNATIVKQYWKYWIDNVQSTLVYT